MAAFSSIDKASLFQNNIIYTGTGSSNALTGVGFQSDLIWTATRNEAEIHPINDSVNGISSYLRSNANDTLETGQTQTITAQSSDGYTVGTEDRFNQSGNTFVSWNWKAGTSSGLSGGTITPSAYSINTTTKFGVYKYTGNATSGATIAHGLGVAPKFLITKKISSTGDWHVAHQDNSAYPWNSYLYLNSSDATQESNSATWFLNNTAPDATNITLGNGAGINGSSTDYIIYAWAPVNGYSDFGKYTGNGDSNGPMVYTGFKPSYIMIKCFSTTSGGAGNWYIFDNKRIGYNIANYSSKANDTDAEATSTYLDIYSNGFKIRNAAADLNGSSNSYLYAAFGQSLVASNGVITTAR